MSVRYQSNVVKICPNGEYVIASFVYSEDAFNYARYKRSKSVTCTYKVKGYIQ